MQVNEIIAGLNTNNVLPAQEEIRDQIRKEKAILIEDIFRVTKLSIPMNENHRRHLNAPVEYFDLLYDQSIDTLEVILATMSAKLNRYMREHLRAQMMRDDDMN
jgi:hypothetical protein